MTLYAALGAVEQGLVYGIMVIGVYLIVTAFLIFVRALQVAGIDRLSGEYVYFPDEGQHVDVGL